MISDFFFWVAVVPPFVATAVMAVVGPVFLIRAFTGLKPLWFGPRSRTDLEVTPRQLRELARFTKTMLLPGLLGGLGLLLMMVGWITIPLSLLSLHVANGIRKGSPFDSKAAAVPLVFAGLVTSVFIPLWIWGMLTHYAPIQWWGFALLPWLFGSCIAGWMLMQANRHLEDRYLRAQEQLLVA